MAVRNQCSRPGGSASRPRHATPAAGCSRQRTVVEFFVGSPAGMDLGLPRSSCSRARPPAPDLGSATIRPSAQHRGRRGGGSAVTNTGDPRCSVAWAAGLEKRCRDRRGVVSFTERPPIARLRYARTCAARRMMCWRMVMLFHGGSGWESVMKVGAQLGPGSFGMAGGKAVLPSFR